MSGLHARRRSLQLEGLAAVAMLVAGACMLGWPGTALATFPGTNGKIAFDSYPPGIETINPDGSGRTRLTTYGQQPAWSPSGDRSPL